MKYGGEFEACKITCMMLMLYFKHFPGIEKCSSVSFHCLRNVEEVKSFVLVKSPGSGQFYGKRLRLLTEDCILKYNADWQC